MNPPTSTIANKLRAHKGWIEEVLNDSELDNYIDTGDCIDILNATISLMEYLLNCPVLFHKQTAGNIGYTATSVSHPLKLLHCWDNPAEIQNQLLKAVRRIQIRFKETFDGAQMDNDELWSELVMMTHLANAIAHSNTVTNDADAYRYAGLHLLFPETFIECHVCHKRLTQLESIASKINKIEPVCKMHIPKLLEIRV